MFKFIVYGFLLSLLSSCTQANTVELKGKILLKGPATHAYLIIEDESSKTSYKIVNESFQQLIKKQNKTCSIKATIIGKALGPRFPATIKVLALKTCK